VRVLTVCEEGLNRSVAARWLLQYSGHEVIPVGLNRHTDQTLEMLYAWADRVIVLDRRLAQRVPKDKLVVWDVGPDHYYQPGRFHPDLVRRLRAFPRLV
jgi:hypothetical protein